MSEQTNEEDFPLGLYWKDKRTTVDRIILPFQSLEVIETINESRATREKEKDFVFKKDPNSIDSTWRNKLIWGDNKYVMSALLDEFSGKIDLIYIDPPFATGANFKTTVTIGDNEVEHTKEASAIEELAYRDTWGKGLDSFMQMMYDRLVIMRELLSEKGSIFVHLDWHVNSYVRLILDEIFGYQNFRNEIFWYYYNKMPDTRKGVFPRSTDTILWYTKNRKSGYLFNPLTEKRDIPVKQLVRKKVGGKAINARDADGNVMYQVKDDRTVDNVWRLSMLQPADRSENLFYPTQKPESLLERIIASCSSEGDLVADFFCGSGTTAAVAEKLGRRWITSDIGRYAIHTARKRFLEIDGCKPFEILNIGKYERQYWQSYQFSKKTQEQTLAEYVAFILQLYKADPLPGSAFIHGKKGPKLVHVGSVEAPVTLEDIENALAETQRMKQSALVILGWEWEMGLHNVVEQKAKANGVHLSLLTIPNVVMDQRAVDAGDIVFYELAYLETEVKKTTFGHQVSLTDFVIPNLDLIPEEVKKLIKKWSDYIDYWSVDWDYKNDTFHNQWQSYRTKKDRSLNLTTDPHVYPQKGDYKVMVKVIDIFGNDTTHIVEIKYR
jgi:adenine-specific DNA-methyltransferase